MICNLHFIVFVTFLVSIICQTSAAKKRFRIEAGERKWPLNPSLQRSTAPKKNEGITSLSSKDTWKYFQNAVQENERKVRREKKAQRKMMTRTFNMQRPSVGLPGPRGPMGPRGPKGANVTAEEMFEEFRSLINDMTKQKILRAADPRCTELCVSTLGANDSEPVDRWALLKEENDLFLPKVISSFMWDLKRYILVPKHAKVELDMFKSASKPGAYGRDSGKSDADSGRFFAPRTGFYTFNARMHIRLPETKVVRSDLFSVQICIDSSLQEKTSLETVSGLGPGSMMTVTVNGLLHLKVNQYVSVFVDNASNSDLTFLDGSQFSGYLVGI
ncbi:adipolin isoform X1 [Parasteatoda tepidariorum]|uniref:adipolin isoform X1 n=2 Tax=Parasteatoda tepidariorum TaxID=114398 RepID=UPI001C71A18B|nr:adipolin [Parasteatoda tepidariorum]